MYRERSFEYKRAKSKTRTLFTSGRRIERHPFSILSQSISHAIQSSSVNYLEHVVRDGFQIGKTKGARKLGEEQKSVIFRYVNNYFRHPMRDNPVFPKVLFVIGKELDLQNITKKSHNAAALS